MTPAVAALALDKHVRPRKIEGAPRGPHVVPLRRGTPAVASTLAAHGCSSAPAASGVNERAAVWSNTAHAPAHFTPALIDRCPSGPLFLSCYGRPSSRTCSRENGRQRRRENIQPGISGTWERIAKRGGARARWRLRAMLFCDVCTYRLMV